MLVYMHQHWRNIYYNKYVSTLMTLFCTDFNISFFWGKEEEGVGFVLPLRLIGEYLIYPRKMRNPILSSLTNKE
jgi:hypothetical protein